MDEGYIKFNCHWNEAPAIDQAHLQPLMDCRDQLFDQGLIGVYEDIGVGFGNISFRNAEAGGAFLISGSKTGMIPKLGADGYSRVLEISLKTNELWCEGPIAASSESMTHAMCYQCDQSIRAVIHVHHRPTWEAQLGKLPTTRSDVGYGTVEMADEVKRLFFDSNLTEKQVFVMAGHEEGIVAFGAHLKAAQRALEQYLV